MIYLKKFSFPSLTEEVKFMHPGESKLDEDADLRPLYHTGSFYPFNVLPYVKLKEIEFDSVTIFTAKTGAVKPRR